MMKPILDDANRMTREFLDREFDDDLDKSIALNNLVRTWFTLGARVGMTAGKDFAFQCLREAFPVPDKPPAEGGPK